MTKTLGYIFIAVSAVLFLVGSFFLITGYVSQELELAGMVLGTALLLLVFVMPLAGTGIVTIIKGRKDQVENSRSTNLRRILDMVKTRGTLDISDIVIEQGIDTKTVQDSIYQLVGMGLFSGYVNWSEGKLYSVEASQLNEITLCKNCGGQLKLAGKGVSKCPFCGTEYFLT